MDETEEEYARMSRAYGHLVLVSQARDLSSFVSRGTSTKSCQGLLGAAGSVSCEYCGCKDCI